MKLKVPSVTSYASELLAFPLTPLGKKIFTTQIVDVYIKINVSTVLSIACCTSGSYCVYEGNDALFVYNWNSSKIKPMVKRFNISFKTVKICDDHYMDLLSEF